MSDLNSDIIICHIIPLLEDIDRLSLCSTNYYFRTQILPQIRFDDLHEVESGDSAKWYFNQLTNIETSCLEFPSTIIKITFQNAFCGQLSTCLPNTVRELTFMNEYSFGLVGILPNYMTHLILAKHPNTLPEHPGTLEGAVPGSVTHLTFGWDLQEDLTQIIPLFIQYLNILLPFNLTRDLYKSRRFHFQVRRRIDETARKILEILDKMKLSFLKELRIEDIVIWRPEWKKPLKILNLNK